MSWCYFMDYPLVNSIGAFLINKRDFYRLSEQNQKILRSSVRKYCQTLVQQTRKENAEAKAVIQESGLKFVKPTDEFIDFLKKGAQKANQANIPELYSKERFERVQKLLDKIRTNPS